MEHWFFHLEASSLESALPDLLVKTLDKGWTALVCFPNTDACAAMDDYLWTFKDDSFLPHGRDDAPLSEHHPIRIAAGSAAADGASAVFLTGGIEPGDLQGVKRLVTLIDGRSESAVTKARAQYRIAREGDADLSYWKQDENGRWAKQ